MAEFLLEKKATDPATYQVHEISCKSLQPKEEPRYLGSYANAEAAFNKSIGLHSAVDYCSSCIKN